MLVTTSRRPGHRARLLGRELARVLPNTEYAPRGVKTVRKLSSLASSRGHTTVMIIDSFASIPKFLRFINCEEGWQWSAVQIELGKIELQKDLGQKICLSGTKIVVKSPEVKELARLLGTLWGLPVEREAGARDVVVVDEDEIRFQRGSERVGPVLHVSGVVYGHGSGQKS